MSKNFKFFDFFPGLNQSKEVYFGSSAPLAQHLNLYSSQLKTLFSKVKTIKQKDLLKELNQIVTNFNRDVAKDLNCERVQLSIINDPQDNACAFCVYWCADVMTTMRDQSGKTTYLDFDKVADLEDIVITKEGYKYKDPKGKILLICINTGSIMKNDVDGISATIAHEIGHCFQDGIFGIYKDIADCELMSRIKYAMNSSSVISNGSIGKTFILFIQWLFFPLKFLANVGRLVRAKKFGALFKTINKEKTFLMKDELEKLDKGETNRIKTDKGVIVTSNKLIKVADDDKNGIVNELDAQIKDEFVKKYDDLKDTEEEKAKAKKRGPVLNFFRSIFANINACSLNVLHTMTLSNYTLKKYNEKSFIKKYEFFADIFASSYGYAPALYSSYTRYSNEMIKKAVEKDLVGMNDPSLLKMGYMRNEWKLIRRAMHNDCHGVWIQRGNAMYTALQYELKNNTSLTTSQRKEIEQHMTMLKEADETYYKDQTENSGFWLKFYETIIEDRIDGKDYKTEEEILIPIQKCADECMVV